MKGVGGKPMKRIKSLQVLLLFFLFFISGCDKDSNSAVIMPLKVGNQWTYEYTWSATVISPVKRLTLVTTIVADTIIQNEEWFRTGSSWYYSNRSNGVYGLGLKVIHVPSMVAKYPCMVGDTFFCEDVGAFKKVISTNEVVATSLGNFICIHYQYTSMDLSGIAQWRFDEFYCPNYGLIKRDFYSVNASSQYVLDNQMVLVSVVLK
jgi:hypothetical protein